MRLRILDKYIFREVVLTGNAWAVKENNTMKSNKLTLYLDPEGRAKVK